MSQKLELKWPSNTEPFSHTEFAQFNGKTNQNVWSTWSESRKNGILISAGERKNEGSKGKPTLLFKVNPNPPVIVEAEKAEPAVKEPKAPKPPKEKKVKVKIEPIAVVNIQPAVAPEGGELTVVAPAPEPVEVVVHALTADVGQLDKVCPVCNHTLQCMKDATGYMVWCNEQIEVCKANENPFGHAKTPAAAYEILMSRFDPSRS